MKYIIFDLDDTILDDKKNISDYTLDILNKAKEEGYLIVINTARSILNTQNLFDIIRPDYAIYNGGAQILDSNKTMIYAKCIGKITTDEIIATILDSNLVEAFSIESSEGLFTSDVNYSKFNKFSNYFDFKNDFFNKEALKILIKTNNRDFIKKISHDYNLFSETYFNGSWNRISPSSKHLGNIALFNYLGDINPEYYCFGDDTGDIEMLRNSTMGILMCNTREELKKLNLRLSEYSNNENGVAKFIEKYLLIS